MQYLLTVLSFLTVYQIGTHACTLVEYYIGYGVRAVINVQN